MEQFRDYLITDRTASDVERARYLLSLWDLNTRTWRGTEAEWAELEAGPKGFYNAKDLNRVRKAADYLAGKLWNMGYNAAEKPPAVYMIAADVSPRGAGKAAGGLFYAGEQAAVRAEAIGSSIFLCWKENGQTVSESAIYTFTATGGRQLTAQFEAEWVVASSVVGAGRVGKAILGRSWE